MNTTKIPIVFWIIAGIGLVWNLMGLGMFASELMISPDVIEAMDEARRNLYEDSPAWLSIVYGIATICGVLGCILLLLRKKLAVPILLVSLVAVLIQMGYSILATNAVEVFGTTQAVIMPLGVIAIGAFLFYYARKSAALGWIK